jgi:uncharacterized protein YndB with AHSA1/START domain
MQLDHLLSLVPPMVQHDPGSGNNLSARPGLGPSKHPELVRRYSEPFRTARAREDAMPEFTIQIDASPERVFEELSHVERHTSWANPKSNMTMEQTGGVGPGPTSTYRSSGVFVGKKVSADITVTAFDPPRRFAIRSDQHQEGKKDVWYVNDYTLAPQGGGTILKKHVTSGLSPVVLFLAALAIKKDAMTSLRNLKVQVESKTA